MALRGPHVRDLQRVRLGWSAIRFFSTYHRCTLPHVSPFGRSTVCSRANDLACGGFIVTAFRHPPADDHFSARGDFYRAAHSLRRGRAEPAPVVDGPANVFVG